MGKSIHDELVKAIIENTPSNENPVDLLMNIVPMSKEAAYRRLRGEIKFTLDEAVKITQKLRTSLRNLFEMYADSNRTSFHLYDLDSLAIDNMKQYFFMLKQMAASFTHLTSSADQPRLYLATSFVWHGLYLKYKAISKFNLFKWIYQMRKYTPIPKLSDIHVPKEIEKKQMEFANLMEKFSCVFILTDDIFHSIVRDISYFYSLGLISDDELAELRKGLYTLINLIEKWANTGKTEHGCPMLIYISEITFDASYIYIEQSNSYQIFSSSLYGLNFLGTEDSKICKAQKEWIESLMRFSSCISNSGEIGRIKFLKKQREFIDRLPISP